MFNQVLCRLAKSASLKSSTMKLPLLYYLNFGQNLDHLVTHFTCCLLCIACIYISLLIIYVPHDMKNSFAGQYVVSVCERETGSQVKEDSFRSGVKHLEVRGVEKFQLEHNSALDNFQWACRDNMADR